MPKLHGTRKQRATELLTRIKRGPSISAPFDGSPLTPAEVIRIYRGWIESWILPDLTDLVPELRDAKRLECVQIFK